MKTALVIPIYQPCDKALPFLSTIDPSSFEKIVIVDDGSGEKYKPIFDEIGKLKNFIVLSYPFNHGKGYALKTGFKYVRDYLPDVKGIVTADGDGQHALEDILRVRDELSEKEDHLVLGVRDFSSPDTPGRNRFGNRFSSGYFKITTGVRVKDTQTGLRGIPENLFEIAITTIGDRYEYEFNFLSDAVKEVKLSQITIKTIYDDNANSHFHPIRDSIRIYRTPLLYLAVALTSFIIDFGLFAAIHYFGPTELPWEVIIPYVGARLISGPYNFLMNDFVVFPGPEGFGRKLGCYAFVFVINMCLGLGLLYLFDRVFPENFGLTLLKIFVETTIFIVNFFVCKVFIFARKNCKRRRKGKANE